MIGYEIQTGESVCCGAILEMEVEKGITKEDEKEGRVYTFGMCQICRRFCKVKNIRPVNKF